MPTPQKPASFKELARKRKPFAPIMERLSRQLANDISTTPAFDAEMLDAIRPLALAADAANTQLFVAANAALDRSRTSGPEARRLEALEMFGGDDE